MSAYLNIVLDNTKFKLALSAACRKLRNKKFDAIAVTGNSGTLFGGALALKLKKRVILVRKPGVDSHGTELEILFETVDSYIFVDDFIDSGATIKRVISTITSKDENMQLVGAYLYRDKTFVPKNELAYYTSK